MYVYFSKKDGTNLNNPSVIQGLITCNTVDLYQRNCP